MATTLNVNASTNFIGAPINDVGTIQFGSGATIQAQFSASQFNGVIILNNVQIVGGAGTNSFEVFGTSLNASGWTFSNWSATDIIDLDASGAAAANINGSSQKDLITGSSQGDTLRGNGGADTINAGLGNDTIVYVAPSEIAAGETVSGGGGTADEIQINAAGTYDFTGITIGGVEQMEMLAGVINVSLLGTQVGAGLISSFLCTTTDNVNITISGSAINLAGVTASGTVGGVITLQGTFGADTITGGVNAVIVGGGGADSLTGTNFTDVFAYNAPSDIAAGETVQGLGSGDGDVLRLTAAGTYDFSGINISGLEKLEMAASDTTIILTSTQFNMFSTLEGSSGVNTMIVNGANVDLSSNTYDSSPGPIDFIFVNGTAADETITGRNGSETIYGAGGKDTMNGGGFTTFVYENASELVAGEALNGSTTAGVTDTVLLNGSGTYDFRTATVTGIDAITIAAAGGASLIFNDTQIENTFGNPIVTFTGSAGADSIEIHGTNLGLGLTNPQNWTDGIDIVTFNGSGSIGGTAFSDVIIGSGSNDSIVGKGGADTMSGGGNNDTFNYEAATDLVAGEQIDGGANGIGSGDVIQLLAQAQDGFFDFSTATISGIETLIINGADIEARFMASQLGAGAITGMGGSNLLSTQILTVAPANSVDLSSFGIGTWGAEDIININGTSGIDTLTGSSQADTIRGEANDDTLTGNAGNDNLNGGNGNDTLNGGTGIDSMVGGLGDDTYVLDSNSDSTIEGVNAGTDIVQASVTHALRANVENLTLTGSSNINGTGNVLDNDIIGNSGNNILNGLGGADDMQGFGGNDTYWIDNAGDTVGENASAGIDIVQSTINYTLGLNVEKLYLRPGGALNGTGNVLSNHIYGNAVANILDGGVGADRLFGAEGNDTYIVDSSGDLIFETIAGAPGGLDTVQSTVNHTLANNVENLTLTGTANVNGTGNAAANIIVGNSGSNFLDGELNSDTLTGGIGVDHFVFTTALGAGNIDTVTDFNVTQDFLRLDDTIFNTIAAGFLSADALAIGISAADATDRIIYDPATGALFFDPNGFGGAAQVQFANIGTGIALTASDIFVF
jgi:Ca2+-binding RTX toxin-like protein